MKTLILIIALSLTLGASSLQNRCLNIAENANSLSTASSVHGNVGTLKSNKRALILINKSLGLRKQFISECGELIESLHMQKIIYDMATEQIEDNRDIIIENIDHLKGR